MSLLLLGVREEWFIPPQMEALILQSRRTGFIYQTKPKYSKPQKSICNYTFEMYYKIMQHLFDQNYSKTVLLGMITI